MHPELKLVSRIGRPKVPILPEDKRELDFYKTHIKIFLPMVVSKVITFPLVSLLRKNSFKLVRINVTNMIFEYQPKKI
jgi:hypothetical protein